jgi:PTH1 family peptidyl-tRNA hydrolase
MNLSGEAVKLVMNYYNIALEDILIIHDELALPLGKLKIKPKGSSGGHNGVQNIIDNLGSEEFARIRIGIDNFKEDIIDYVLGKFSRKERKLLDPILEDAPNMLAYFDKNNLEKFMSYYNTKYNE